MRSSFKILKVMGISIEVHFTFVLFFMFLLLTGLENFVFFSIIFAIVLAHELCHSMIALFNGIPVPKIVLLPFGGLASIEIPEEPLTELKVSVAGPLFNFFFAGVSFIAIKILGLDLLNYGSLIDVLMGGGISVFTASFVLSMLVMVNLLLGLFNMMPAFPMDGGRVFRAILALWLDYSTATRIAGSLGRIIFLFLIIAGVLSLNIWWIIIGFFLMYAGNGEVKLVLLKNTFKGLTVKDLVEKQGKLPVVKAELTLREFLNKEASPSQRFYLVSNEDGTLSGIIDLNMLQEGRFKSNTPLASFANTNYGILEGSTKVTNVFKRILSKELTLVIEGDRMLGYLTPGLLMNYTNFYRIKRK